MPKRSPGPISHVTSSRILRPVTVTVFAADVTSSISSLNSGCDSFAACSAAACSAARSASGTPASTSRGSVRSSTATSTLPCTCGSAYMAGTTSTRDAEASICATSGSMSDSPCACSKICVTSIRSTTCLPSREVAICFNSNVLRTGGTSAINSRAAFTWNFCLVERARAPRVSHANSLRARLRRFVSRTSAWRSRSTRCSIYAE